MEKQKVWMSVFIVVIMVMSTAGFVLNYAVSEGRTVNYKDATLKVNSKGTFLQANGQSVKFEYLPQQLEEISAEGAAIQRINSTLMVYMTSDYNTSSSNYVAQAEFDLAQALGAYFKIYSVAGFTEQTQTTAQKITCANSTAYVPVIYFKESNETRILLDGDCVLMEAKTALDFSALKDRLLYGMFGVMS